MRKLDELLAGSFNFTTHLFGIPSIDAEAKLAERLILLRRGKSEGDLLIVYYAGHAGGSEGNCIWTANLSDNSPELCWQNIQGLILGWPSDSLFIFDCCASLLALSPHPGKGDNWLFGSSAKESVASGVRWNSFTSLMIRELERRANIYQENHGRFNVLDIDHGLSNHDRGDLLFSSVCKRLTEHDCYPTDLTPLSPYNGVNRVQTLPSDIGNETAHHSTFPLSQRPRHPYHTVSEPSNPREPKDYVQDSTLYVKFNTGDVQTIWLTGLPSLTDASDIVQWFEHRLGKQNLITKIGPFYEAGPVATTVTFCNVVSARKALSISDCRFQASAGGPTLRIALGKVIPGITYVYSSDKSPKKEPNVDILLIHGAGGHPVNSFASHSIDPPKEVMWPRDELPEVLEAAEVYPNVVTLGWDANLWLTDQPHMRKSLEDLVRGLKHKIAVELTRPLFVIAHGVGGLLAKMMVNSLINEGVLDKNFSNPVKGCFFFAVPHHATEYGEFTSILAGMKSAYPFIDTYHGGTQNPMANDTLVSTICTEFDAIRKEHSIKTFSFFEELPTDGHLIVPQQSAILDTREGQSAGLQLAHHEISKLPGARSNAQLIIEVIRHTIHEIIHPVILPKQPSTERTLAMLKKYDTIFVVDDSDSMAGIRWKTAAKVLARIAAIAIKYDRNGVDIRFFNDDLEDDRGQNIKDAEKVMDLFSAVEPEGPTLTADVLEVTLNAYMYEYGQNRRKKPLNLIILTDGEPDPDQNVEEVIKKYANQLKEAKAPPLQVGIQFVQIGGDPDAAKFLESLDDDLQDRYGLDRDVRSH